MYKLIRDRIPDIIRARGQAADVRIEQPSFDKDEYRELLLSKLDEEVQEFKDGPSIEELADIAEVLRALAWNIGYTGTALDAVREGKRAARGGFNDGFILLSEVPGYTG